MAGLRVGLVALLVRDYDEAIDWYVSVLGFELVEDTPLGDAKRWVVVAPGGGSLAGSAVLLARAAGERQVARVGDQTGGRVGWFLCVDDFGREYERMRAAGVEFEGTPRQESYGVVTVFRDLYGNRWDLIEPGGASPGAPGPDPGADY